MTMPTKALVILSGGQDSTTCLFWAKDNYDEVYAVTYDYGQKHAIEIESAKRVALLAGVQEHCVVHVGNILQGTSPLTNTSEKLEQYDSMFALPGGLEKTFVPGRNILFLTLAANHAYVRGIDVLVTGVCEEDFGGYPDCRNAFIKHMEMALVHGLDKPALVIETPLMNLTKAASIHLAQKLPGCMHAMAYTHTSYDGQFPPVGNDHATLLRAKGFVEAGVADPLVCRAVILGLMECPGTTNYDAFRSASILPAGV